MFVFLEMFYMTLKEVLGQLFLVYFGNTLFGNTIKVNYIKF